MTARRAQKEVGRVGRNIPPSTVLARAQVAATCLFDTPFILRHKHHLVEGVIDLAFLEQEAWVLVQVKVDGVSAPEQEAQAQTPQPQLLLAAFALERLTGRQVKDLVLFFTHSQHEVTMAWGDQERTLAESLVETTLSMVEEF
jgi:ATP-dependent exoDNAse (exonuclease V) beta subunit